MDWREMIYGRGCRGLLAFGLVLVILFSLFSSGITVQTVRPENPVENGNIKEISELQLGNLDGEEKQAEQKTEEATTPSGQDNVQGENAQLSQIRPEVSKTEEAESEDQNTGDGEQGQEDGNQGEEGGEEAELDVAMVMTWYKYGSQPKTIVCSPEQGVYKTINTAQLLKNKLKYEFYATGEDANDVQIVSVSVKAGDGEYAETSDSGEIKIELPDGASQRNYTFSVNALYTTKNSQGEKVEQEISFTYVLYCIERLDVDLELSWSENDGTDASVICGANQTAAKTVESNTLTENLFAYTPKLVGSEAENARIVDASYTTASGGSGTLNPKGGSFVMQTVDGSDEETYYLLFGVEMSDGEGGSQTVFYKFTIVFVEVMDLQLSFTWYVKGTTPVELICQPDKKVSADIRNNQLSAGAVKYEMELQGANAETARILQITYTAEGGDSGTLRESGALPVALPNGFNSNKYTISVMALSGGKQMTFKVVLDYSMDLCLEMRYVVDGENRMVACENGKTATAEEIYDDQLSEGQLNYAMSFAGTDGAGVSITSVTCYQSGSGRTLTLNSSDSAELLLKDGKTGENTFTVKASDESGAAYEFKINIPYKHRGEASVKITTNLTNGQTVINETFTNLSVTAYSVDSENEIIGYIPANGTDTILKVELDGEEQTYVSSSGTASEYALYPDNPEVGDTNTHTLYIYAEDAYGNYGELTLTLKGQRNQAGQVIGTATIMIDMTVLGIKEQEVIAYEVLADEPISYSVAKAVMGKDTGEPFGSCPTALGWGGTYAGTLDTGFYLERLTPGIGGNVLTDSNWPGSSEAEVLQSIDNRFGKGTGLATLWRCIYRNGLNKSGGTDGSYGEHDYTSGSGWLYSLNGTYYPGQSMSAYYLKNGDVLTLRYTLAYGWDVGGGSEGYGNTAGYCVTALNGSFYINHRMETVTHADGSTSYVCKCCGLEEGCTHENAIWKNQGDGTHIRYCDECKEIIGDPGEHIWEQAEEKHICSYCNAEEAHIWKDVEGSDTASCTEDGVKSVCCSICNMTKTGIVSPAKGHTLDNRWNYTKTEHYQKCSTCKEEVNRGSHQYVYDAEWEDYECTVCHVLHDWDVGCGGGFENGSCSQCGSSGSGGSSSEDAGSGGNDSDKGEEEGGGSQEESHTHNYSSAVTAPTCTEQGYTTYSCSCGDSYVSDYVDANGHMYENGNCTVCGDVDPNYVSPDDAPETDDSGAGSESDADESQEQT